MVVHCRKANYDIYVGRDSGGAPGDAPVGCPWGNPFSSLDAKALEGFSEVSIRTATYLQWALSQPNYLARARSDLRGKVLGNLHRDLQGAR